MPSFAAFDRHVLAVITDASTRQWPFPIKADHITTKMPTKAYRDQTQIERSLQRLRKQGIIEFLRTDDGRPRGWALTKTHCPTCKQKLPRKDDDGGEIGKALDAVAVKHHGRLPPRDDTDFLEGETMDREDEP